MQQLPLSQIRMVLMPLLVVFFILGTIDLQDHHATVEFPIKKGILEAADFIADFVQGKAH